VITLGPAEEKDPELDMVVVHHEISHSYGVGVSVSNRVNIYPSANHRKQMDM
jgi:hypothetical protein